MRKLKHKIDINFDKNIVELEKPNKIFFDKKTCQIRILEAVSWLCEQPSILDLSLSGNSEDIRTLNSTFRNIDKPTDVLSFPAPVNTFSSRVDPDCEGYNPLGSVVVCLPVCLKQAKKFRISLAQEVEKMIVHGLIHLKGFDHERGPSAHKIMRSVERAVLNQIEAHWGPATWISLK